MVAKLLKYLKPEFMVTRATYSYMTKAEILMRYIVITIIPQHLPSIITY